MLPIYKSEYSVYNYDEIPEGYYYKVMLNGHPIQRFWHRNKFEEIAYRVEDGDVVLDFGCGPGSFTDVLSQQKPTTKIVGLDMASRQIDFAKKNISQNKINGMIDFVCIDQNNFQIPYSDGFFDKVTCIEVIEHIHPFFSLKILEEIRRVLKVNGRLIITTPNYRSLWPFIEIILENISPVKYHEQHINKFTPNAFVKFLETAGFNIIKVNSIFIVAPFLSIISQSLANKINKLEKKLDHKLGELLIVEAKSDPQLR